MTYENFVVEGFVDSVAGIAKGVLGPVTSLLKT
jgi:hypothetical protein